MGAKVHAKFDDSRSNRSRNIRLPHFVRTTTPAYAGHHIRAKRRLPKNHFVAAEADIDVSIKRKLFHVSLNEEMLLQNGV